MRLIILLDFHNYWCGLSELLAGIYLLNLISQWFTFIPLIRVLIESIVESKDDHIIEYALPLIPLKMLDCTLIFRKLNIFVVAFIFVSKYCLSSVNSLNEHQMLLDTACYFNGASRVAIYCSFKVIALAVSISRWRDATSLNILA